MFKNRTLFFSLALFIISTSFNAAWAQKNTRQQLKERFRPSKNIQQLHNVDIPQAGFSAGDHDKTTRGPVDKSSLNIRLQEQQPFVGEYAIYQSEYEAKIEEEIAFVKGSISFEVFKKTGWVKIPLVSSSVGLKEASLNRKPSFVIREGNDYKLVVNQPGIYDLSLEFFTKVIREREHGPGSLSLRVLPSPISLLDVEMEETEIEIFVEPSIKIETEKTAKATLATVVLPFTEHVTIRWSKALPKEIIPEAVLEPKIYADTSTLASIGDGLAKCFSTIRYSILQSEVSNLKVSFPEDVGILNVSGNQLRDWKVKTEEGRQTLDVYLNYGVKGSYELNLTYERNIGAGSVTAELPEIYVVGAERQRGFVGTEARTNIELAFNKLSGGAQAIDVKELPQEVWSKATNPVLLAFKYLTFPYSAVIEVTKHQELPVLVAAIDFASYVSLFTKEGKVLTKATYQLRNNVKQFVRLSLPKGASLWSCFVSGKSVKPAKDKQNRILIPLEKSQIRGQVLTQFPVEIVYLTKNPRFNFSGKLRLELPKSDIPQNELFWSVYFPKKYSYFRFDGDVELLKKAQVSPSIGRARFAADKESVRAKFKGRKKVRPGREGRDFFSSQQAEIEEQVLDDIKSAQIRGVLPIKIDVPARGRLYRFSKLLVTDEGPWMSTFYVRSSKPLGLVIFLAILAGMIILIVKKKAQQIKMQNV